jgi:hypothetical protein
MVDRNPDRVFQYAVGFCLFALTFVTYSDVLHHEFVNYDDLQPAHSAPPSALEQRLGLGVAAGGPTYPAVSPGVSGDRQRALRWQSEEVSPDRGEIGVG